MYEVLREEIRRYEMQMRENESLLFRKMIDEIQKRCEVTVVDPSTRQKVGVSEDDDVIYEQIENFDIKWVRTDSERESVQKIVDKFWVKIAEVKDEENRKIERLKHGDELHSGVMEMVKVYVAMRGWVGG